MSGPKDDFVTSYNNHNLYPSNLVYKGEYSSSLLTKRLRLDENASNLFTSNPDEIVVFFRDVVEGGPRFERLKACSDDELQRHLGHPPAADESLEPWSRKNPKCRFIFLMGGHSRRPLSLTLLMFRRIMTFHQVMAAYLDFVSIFGTSSGPRELRFSGFRELTPREDNEIGPVRRHLGTSEHRFQLCYNLKAPEQLEDDASKFSIRQAAIHHQFDLDTGNTVWIVTKGNRLLKDRIEELTGPNGRQIDRKFDRVIDCFRSSLAVHLLLAHWSVEEWRYYLQHYEDLIDAKTILAVEGSRDIHPARLEYRPYHVQIVQSHEEKVNEAITAMEANVNILSALAKFYSNFINSNRLQYQRVNRVNSDTFESQIGAMAIDLESQIARAKHLVLITSNRKQLILQHLQTQATEVMETLTTSMYQVGIMTQKDAIAMKIITVVTLIYLPATFVSTFFSTDVVKYQNPQMEGNNFTSFSPIALQRWLEVTLPLTLLTFASSIFFYRKYAFQADFQAGHREKLPFYYKSWTQFFQA